MCACASAACNGVALLSRSDRPDGLVRNHQSGDLLAGQRIESIFDLTIEHDVRVAELAFLERLSDADDGSELGAEGCGDLAIHHLIGLAEQAPSLRVPDDHVLRPCLDEHPGAHLARECTFTLVIQRLAGDADVRASRGFRHRMQSRKRRRHNDLDVVDVLHDAAEFLDERDGLVDRLVHLPIPRDEWRAHS